MQVLSEQTVAEARHELATVRKAVLDLGREHVAAVKLTIRSSSERPVALQVIEEFPGHVSMSDIQVHPGYNPEKWSISKADHRMGFETEIPPWGEVETIYGIRASLDELEAFADEPRIATVREASGGKDVSSPVEREAPGASDPPESNEGGPDADAEDVTGARDLDQDEPPSSPDAPVDSADAGSGAVAHTESADDRDADTDPSPAPESTDDTDTTAEPSADSFVYGEGRSPPESRSETTGRGGKDRSSPSHGPATDQGVTVATDPIETLILAAARGDLSESQRTALRAVLGLEAVKDSDPQPDDGGSTAEKLASIADSLDRLIERLPSPGERTEELTPRLDRLAEAVADLESATRQGVDERERLQTRLDELEGRVDRVYDDYSQLERLAARVGELEDLFDADEAEAIGEVLAAERAWRHRHDAVRSR